MYVGTNIRSKPSARNSGEPSIKTTRQEESQRACPERGYIIRVRMPTRSPACLPTQRPEEKHHESRRDAGAASHLMWVVFHSHQLATENGWASRPQRTLLSVPNSNPKLRVCVARTCPFTAVFSKGYLGLHQEATSTVPTKRCLHVQTKKLAIQFAEPLNKNLRGRKTLDFRPARPQHPKRDFAGH